MSATVNREDWKSQYRELLDEMEQKEGGWLRLDEALRSVASRLAIAAMGRDPELDKHLDSILIAIKERMSEKHLLTRLDGLAAAVLEHERQIATIDAVDLSRFVASLELSPSLQSRFINELDSGSATMRMQALSELAGELNSKLSDPVSVEAEQVGAYDVEEVLSTLARHMNAIPELQLVVDKLKKKITEGSSSGQLEEFVEQLTASVRTVIETIANDKKELEKFLEQVTKQLAQFEEYTRGNESEATDRSHDTESLSKSMEIAVGQLRSDMDSANEMSELKMRVQGHIDSIAETFREFKENEAERTTKEKQRSAKLLQQIDRMKVRTSELAKKCVDQENRLMHDTLTGVYSRYAYELRLREEFQRWQRHGQPLSFAIWDIDFFKKVNDGYGHQAGDRLLTAVARLLTDTTRVEDFVARVGGEEFVVLFPATSRDSAYVLVERLREKIAAIGFHFKGQPITVTVSCGLTEFQSGDTPESVYDRADQALYRAKAAGRNRTELS